MTTLTPPRANIPIGWVSIDGRKVPAAIEPEWLRYLAGSLYERSGGTTGASTGDLETAQFEDAGIDDLKAEVRRLSDEMPFPVLIHEIPALMSRMDALEQEPVAVSQVSTTVTTASGNDLFATTFGGAL